MGNSTWFLLRSGAGEAAFNMAVDEALLESLPRLGRPVLRFYGWIERAASFGYFQKYAEIERLTGLRPLVRRPTGGGLVPHEADWTYSLAFPTEHAWYSLTACESYRRVHEWIQAALTGLGLETELAPSPSRAQPGECFTGHEQSDLLWRGQKIAGAAQRRRREGLLIQGSLQPGCLSNAPARVVWEQAMCDAARLREGADWMGLPNDTGLEARARELAQQKYSQADYNRKR
jgi:lipoate-protein ligase A